MGHIAHTGFQSLLYYVFIFEKKYRVDETAKKLGIHVQTLYDYIEGVRYFPPDLIPDLYFATKDYRFLEFFLKPCGLVAVPVKQIAESKKDILNILVSGAKEDGDVVRAVKYALDDGKISTDELREIEKEIDEAIREKELLRKAIREAVKVGHIGTEK